MARVLGKSEIADYFVNSKRNSKDELVEKPTIVRIVREEKEIELFAGDVPQNATTVKYEGKEYNVLKWGSDGTAYVYVDFVEEVAEDKSYGEAFLKDLLSEWNEQEIKKSDRMMAWCRLHGKDPKDVCVEDLRDVLGIITFTNCNAEYITFAGSSGVSISPNHMHTINWNP